MLRRLVQRRIGRVSARAERGYIALATALMLMMIMMMAALAVDVGYFYVQSNRLQRAADAGALAGVTRLPVLFLAEHQAVIAAEHNGVHPGGNVSVTAEQVPESPRRLRVTVSDSDVTTFFGKLIVDHISMSRSATAEYVSTIPLGSALNAIGTGDLNGYGPGGTKQNFWLAASGPCTTKEDGDLLLSEWAQTARDDIGPPYNYECGPSSNLNLADPRQNLDFNANGYDYQVTLPCATAGYTMETCPAANTPYPVAVDVFDPGFNPQRLDPATLTPTALSASYPDRFALRQGGDLASQTKLNAVVVDTVYTLYGYDPTPNDNSDDAGRIIQRMTCSNDTCTLNGGVPAVCSPAVADTTDVSLATRPWCRIGVIPASQPAARYRLNVTTVTGTPSATSFGSNSFGFRAYRDGSGFSSCSSVPSMAGYNAFCPSISGDSAMGAFNNSPGTTAEFFLAQLSPAAEFRGKKLQVILWDPGEGASSIEILPPGSSSANFIRYRTWIPGVDGPEYSTDQGVGWPTPLEGYSVDVSGTVATNSALPPGPPWGANLLTKARNAKRFNGRKLLVEINVPTDYGLDAAGHEVALPDKGWWKIRYNYDAATPVTSRRDRTTWSVQLVGDPVHLVH